jgi:quinoprotein dehydrogenase-associated probable ABC transporter substrate-binding protein
VLGVIVVLPIGAAPATQPAQPAARVLHVAADPNNLPFSNDRGEGFENTMAQLIARDLGATVEYTWRAQRRGFFRETLKHGDAELVMGVPREFEKGTLQTSPYYRSGYVFVSRADRSLDLHSLDDAALRSLKVGVHVVGDGNATPPAQALARRGIVDNVVGYSIYGDYREPNPPARIIDAVANGEVDVAIVWGPLAGYFAKHQPVTLTVVPVEPQLDPPALPLAFDICVGVKRGNKALRDEIDGVLQRRGAEVASILDEYGVPRVPAPEREK